MRKFPPRPSKPKGKGCYIGAPAYYKLELACQHLYQAFCNGDDGWTGGIYVVGSCMQKPDFRDVDVRMILADEEFKKLFQCKTTTNWAWQPRWLVMNVALSLWLKEQTQLNIDFQIQPQSWANEHHKGKVRNAIGFTIAED